MKYAKPNTPGSLVEFKAEYGNYIGGKWVGPFDGQFFEAICPATGKPYTKVARSNEKDIEFALDAAHAAAPAWGKTSVTERSNILLKVADRLEQNLEKLAVAECHRSLSVFRRRHSRRRKWNGGIGFQHCFLPY